MLASTTSDVEMESHISEHTQTDSDDDEPHPKYRSAMVHRLLHLELTRRNACVQVVTKTSFKS